MQIKEAQKESFKIIDEYNKKHGLEHNKETAFPHLIEEVGELAKELNHGISNWRDDFKKENFSEEIADVLNQLFNLATYNDVDLEDSFIKKIKKLRQRYELTHIPDNKNLLERMQIKEAQEKVNIMIDELGGYWQPLSMMARLTEEVGELARAMNIRFGGKKSKFKGDGREIEKEIADVVFTTFAISNMLGIDIDTVLNEKIDSNIEKLKKVYIDGS